MYTKLIDFCNNYLKKYIYHDFQLADILKIKFKLKICDNLWNLFSKKFKITLLNYIK